MIKVSVINEKTNNVSNKTDGKLNKHVKYCNDDCGPPACPRGH